MLLPRFLHAGLAMVFLVLAPSATAQFLAYPDEAIQIEKGPAPGALSLSWQGHAGRAYFLQYSPSLDAGSWLFLPFVEPGGNAKLSFGASAPGDGGRFFARNIIQASPSANPANEDFDGDKLSSMDEIQAGLNPLASSDTDGDSLPDDWERFYFGGLSRNGSNDSDGDGMSDAAEFTAGRHPNTSIVYGTVTYRWAEEDAANKTVFFRDDRNAQTYGESETVLVARYTDAALTRLVSLEIYFDFELYNFLYYYDDEANHVWLTPTVEYTIASASPAETGLVFTGNVIGSRHGRDLLRKVDGKPYSYVTTPQAKRVPAYLAVTSQPLTKADLGSFPAILRDFPYGTEEYYDFGNARHGDGAGALEPQLGAAANEYERLPVLYQPRKPIQSAESFYQWYHKPDALAVTVGKSDADEFIPGYNGILEGDLLHLQTNDVGRKWGRLCFTVEVHLKLKYDVNIASLSKTLFTARGDDSLWIYFNGRLVFDAGGGGSTGDPVSLSDFPDIFPRGSDTGICDVAIFYAEQQATVGKLEFQTNAETQPVYVYQVVADLAPNLVPAFSLSSAPSGMTIGQTGKIFWDYSQAAPGDYPVEVLVSAGFATPAVHSFVIRVDQTPFIFSQPQSKTVRTGKNTVFQVGVRGDGLVYQWRRNGLSIPGATGPILELANIQPSDAGEYSVDITGTYGNVSSASAVLTVDNTPYFIFQPDHVYAVLGDDAVFSAMAEGTSLVYQWYKCTFDVETEVETIVPVLGATMPQLFIPSVAYSDRASYYVTVTNAEGSISSWNVELIIIE